MSKNLDEIIEIQKGLFDKSHELISKLRESIHLLKEENAKQALTKATELFETSIDPFQEYIKARMDSIVRLNEKASKTRESVALKKERLKELLSSLATLCTENKEKIKAAKTKPIKKPKTIKTQPSPEKAPDLLSPEKLREQIIQKLQAIPKAPRSTGNIWENWGQNHPESSPKPSDPTRQKEDNP